MEYEYDGEVSRMFLMVMYDALLNKWAQEQTLPQVEMDALISLTLRLRTVQ